MRMTNEINALDFIATPSDPRPSGLCDTKLPGERAAPSAANFPIFRSIRNSARLNTHAEALFKNQANWKYNSNFLIFRSVGPLVAGAGALNSDGRACRGIDTDRARSVGPAT
jgi:hypothetical protein